MFQCDLSTEEKIEEVKEVLKTQEKASPEIQHKLSEISNQEKSDQTLIKNQEKRALYSSKAEAWLDTLEKVGAARYVTRINRSKPMSLEEIIETATIDGTEERGLKHISSVFEGKTAEEIKTYCESIIQKAEALEGLCQTKVKMVSY